jgi:hypothetical protein
VVAVVVVLVNHDFLDKLVVLVVVVGVVSSDPVKVPAAVLELPVKVTVVLLQQVLVDHLVATQQFLKMDRWPVVVVEVLVLAVEV